MFEIKNISTSISLAELKNMASEQFGTMVKAVVDIEQRIMAIGAELHSDEESFMLANGSNQNNLWGINIYPDIEGVDRIEFDSMINIRPFLGNHSRDVENPETQKQIIEIVNKLITE